MKNKNKEKIIKIIKSLLLSFGLIFFMNYSPLLKVPKYCRGIGFIASNLCKLSINFNFFNINYTLLIIAVAYLIYKISEKPSQKRISCLILSMFFAGFILIGKTYDYSYTLRTIFNTKYNLLMSILLFITYTCFLKLLLNKLYDFLDNYKSNKEKRINNKIIDLIFYKHPFLSCFISTLIIGIIYLIAFYPGTIAYDGMWQLDFYYGIRIFSDHHPAIVTLIMGNLLDFGTKILNNNFGIFLYIIIQVLFNSFVYSYVLHIMNKTNINIYIRIGTFIFFNFTPFLTIYSITYIKDVIYYLLFLLIFTYQYYHLYYLNENKIKNYLVIFGLLFFLFLYRNTGFYVAIIDLLFILLTKLKDYKVSVIMLLFMIASFVAIKSYYDNTFLVASNIQKASVREMLSVPLQQTGRYLKYHYDDLTDEEIATLHELFNGDLKKLGQSYNPTRSDSIKSQFLEFPTDDELKTYFKLWFKMFLKHPFTYVEATANNTYGYFYLGGIKNCIHEELGFYSIVSDPVVNKGNLDVYLNEDTEEFRNALYYYAKIFSDTPVIGYVYSCSLYSSILIIISFYFLKNKNFKILCYLMPLFLSLFICIISPVNAHMRYLFPIAVSTPMLIAILNIELKKRTQR